MDWALDAFSWLAPDLLAELLVALGGVTVVAFFKKTPAPFRPDNCPANFLTEFTPELTVR